MKKDYNSCKIIDILDCPRCDQAEVILICNGVGPFVCGSVEGRTNYKAGDKNVKIEFLSYFAERTNINTKSVIFAWRRHKPLFNQAPALSGIGKVIDVIGQNKLLVDIGLFVTVHGTIKGKVSTGDFVEIHPVELLYEVLS